MIRVCVDCGREIALRELGKNGIGLKVEKGDSVVIPKGWLTISANPIKGRGQLSRHGLHWFSKLAFMGELSTKNNEFPEALENIEIDYMNHLKRSGEFVGIEFDDDSAADEILSRIKDRSEIPEYWLYFAASYAETARDAVMKGDAATAGWAMACSERLRSMWIFQKYFEEVVWMGHSARRLIDLTRLWDQNKTNRNENFWQIKLKEFSFSFSQILATPVTFIQEKAYIGGQGIDRKDARLVDFLLASGGSHEAGVVEIKSNCSPPARGLRTAMSGRGAGRRRG